MCLHSRLVLAGTICLSRHLLGLLHNESLPKSVLWDTELRALDSSIEKTCDTGKQMEIQDTFIVTSNLFRIRPLWHDQHACTQIRRRAEAEEGATAGFALTTDVK